jgi:hypothetical protein
MIINHFDAVRVSFSPLKADTPLLIDTDAVLTGATTCQLLKVIRRWDAQIRQRLGSVKNLELSSCRALHLRRDLPGKPAPEQPFRLFVGKTSDHADQ